MKIVVSGGTGFIGKALTSRLLQEGHQVTLLTRNLKRRGAVSDQIHVEYWDAKTLGVWGHCINRADAVINLAGEPIADKRWTRTQKGRIIESRLSATSLLVAAMRKAQRRPAVLINASAVGYYGDVPEGEVDETFPAGSGFLADLCVRWEAEAREAEALGLRVVCLRTGIVLGKDGGALHKMLPPFQMFVGGTVGSGKQWVPWIHRDDVLGIVLFALTEKKISGPINMTAPEPVRMKEFCKVLARTIERPALFPLPAMVLRAVMGEMSDVLLTGQCAVPRQLCNAGYRFSHQRLDEALPAALKK